MLSPILLTDHLTCMHMYARSGIVRMLLTIKSRPVGKQYADTVIVIPDNVM